MPLGRRDVAERAAGTSIGAAQLLSGLAKACVARLRLRVDCFVERRRTARVRRDPAPLVILLASAKRVLIVCHGNIIRSPFAAALIADGLGECAGVSISSAGLVAVPGRPAHPTAILTAVTHGVNLSEHTAATVTSEAVANADVIFLMDVPQLAVIRRRFRAARSKTFLLASLVADAPLEIDDPVDGDEAVFRACYEHIFCAVRPIVRVLSAMAQRQ